MPVEIERKFRLKSSAEVPDLSTVVTIGESQHFNLNAVYFDTPALTLARNSVTLRRRTGGEDAGWHLKLPKEGHARVEVHEPIVEGASELVVPAALRDQVAELVGYQPLAPIVDLQTDRTQTELTGPRGKKLALMCEDKVTATRAGEAKSWRELEIELTGGDEDLLDTLTAALAEQKVKPAKATSKLVQAMGDQLAEETRVLNRKSSSAEVIGAYLAEQVGVIQGREAEVRVDAPDAVHKMRVATRRLRSALRTFRALLDTGRTEALRAELKWLGEMLGGPRDAEVLRAELLDLVDELPDGLLLGPVKERLEHELGSKHAETHAELVEALDSERYHQLADALVQLISDPPFVQYADARAKGVLPELLDLAGRSVMKEWKKAQDEDDPHAHELIRHEARKKAKAARYAWEAVVPAFGEDAKASAVAWEQVTESLGSAQDSVVVRERLLELAEVAEEAGEPTFSYGVLYQRQTDRGASSEVEAGDAIKVAKKASLSV